MKRLILAEMACPSLRESLTLFLNSPDSLVVCSLRNLKISMPMKSGLLVELRTFNIPVE